MEITDFINARLDEDEAALRDDDDDQPGELRFRDMDDRTSEYTWTFANNDRVKREVAAKRAIVARYEVASNQVAVGVVNENAGYGRADPGWPLRADSHELDVRNLAAVWPDHPDYKQEWAL